MALWRSARLGAQLQKSSSAACNPLSRTSIAAFSSRLLNQTSSLFSTAQPHPEASDLQTRLRELIPEEQARLKEIRKKYGNVVLGETTVDMAIGGMRGIKGMIWEPSLLDANEGIRFRGFSIPECQKLLPKIKPDGEPLPEGLLWLLMTGEVPTIEQALAVSEELKSRAKVPGHVERVLNALPSGTHPMTQFTAGIMALQTESVFAKAYAGGIHKSRYWEPCYEDAMDCIARVPALAAMIYRKTFKDGKVLPGDNNLDYSGNFAHMMGFDDPQFHELMRLYIVIHSAKYKLAPVAGAMNDKEDGRSYWSEGEMVGSALSDPYLSFAAGMNGLAGPLHGLANQECLRWLRHVVDEIGVGASKDELQQFVQDTLKAGKVVPGFGHAVLRKTDPRYTCQREFALKHLSDNPMVKLVSNVYEVVPDVLLKTGKVNNPWPNVDAHSGVLLQHYGLTEENFYTVLFGVSRAMGVLTQLVWDRALGLPIERPKSLTTKAIVEFCEKKASTMAAA
ncbi:hypothetical protein CBR_g11008 [Chara braunii]|uniref:Citrate synthase n=1 Tax=Chara braunii TaxID=69332 RepID=A0A388KPT7_CHABU|nr:hypothetical protein CBR_g11008 [Chara braunii]|eukprot:GBG72074.1 hypothetical protein CBR_g11008 [Chara braunii]